jgi:hypothetical protein
VRTAKSTRAARREFSPVREEKLHLRERELGATSDLCRRVAVAASAVACALWAAPAGAVDVGQLDGDSIQLDVTETTIVSQHFDARDNELPQDSGWGDWINRLNAAARWGRWTAGLRLDSSVYWRRPIDNPDFSSLPLGTERGQTTIIQDNESRYRNSIYPAKMWVTYAAPGVELTAGDAYVQFGRGLTLSMRKIDELGIDTTVRGAKVEVQKDPFALIAVAGFGNPARIDEATGRALFPTTGNPSEPVFGSDRLIGLEIQAGRGLPVTLATRAVRFTRCAPYHYDSNGQVVTDFLSDPGDVVFGSCDANDTGIWLQSLPSAPPPLAANDITMAGQSLEVPNLWGHGKLYVEAAVQERQYALAAENVNHSGNALYASLSVDAGPVTNTLEVKSNRNFYPVAAGVDLTRAPEFNIVAYSFSPPAETATILDTEFGYFNACVNGGRLRSDVRADADLLLYGQGIFAYSQTEQVSGACDALGHTVAPVGIPGAKLEDAVWDGLAGVELYFDDKFSHAFVSLGVRDDTKASGDLNYRERHLEYSIVKYLGHAVSIEAQGFHRMRREESMNATAASNYVEEWWNEGENYFALKIAPSWVFSQGFEYTTLAGQPPYYFNGSVLYKFTSSSNVRLFVGQQRGAFRCAAGVCRYFPPFEGARAEVTWRF